MSFGGFDSQQHHHAKAEINVVPLVDVMLVLLVIFIITAPLLTHSVKIDLPKASSNPNITKSEHVELAVREDGSLYWNGVIITQHMLTERFVMEAKKEPQPELHIRADRLVPYEKVAQVMSAAAKTGLLRIGFVTEPASK